ncbi:MAG: efflux RND transporter permease subunit [Bryobacterales bacterium]|nr:efflux RND transporter permease subunit [Bryobacterales bacterium]
MKGLIAWFARNHVVANLLLFVIVASGIFTLGTLKMEVFPEFSLDTVSVTAEYRGAAPEEVEEAICLRIEEAIQGLEGIKKITSTAQQGRGSVTAEIHLGYDVRSLMDDIKTQVDAIDTFPDDVEKPIVQELSARYQVINVSVSADADLLTLKQLGVRVREDIKALPEVSHADLLSAPPYEISIEVSEEALRRWGLTFDQVANAVRRFSVDLPGGSVKTRTGEVLLRTNGQAYTGEEFERLPLLRRPDGTRIYLRDVATVVDGFEDVTLAAMLDGKPSVVVKVYRVGDQNAIRVAEAVYEYVEQVRPTLPAGVEIATWQDSARLLKSRIDLLVRNAMTGLTLVFIVLALFMRLRLAFWVSIGIPVSFLGAIALMPIFGVSINMMSLFSFILVLGIVVDDAIVVGENIHTTQVRTGKGTVGAIRGTYQVLIPVAFGVMTTMAAFSPMLFVPGIMGKIVRVFPLIILPTLFFSLVESNLILPCHLRHFKKRRVRKASHPVASAWNAFFDMFSSGLAQFVRRVYQPALRVALEWRYLTLSVAVALILATAGMVGAGKIRWILFPNVESDSVVAFLTMPMESPVSVTATGVDVLTKSASELRREIESESDSDQVRHIMSSVGEHPFREVQSGPASDGSRFRGENLGEVHIELVPAEVREITAEEVAARWREKVGQIPGAIELTITSDLIGGGKAIDLQFSATDLDTLVEVAEITKAHLAGYPGVIEVTDTYRGGKPEINLSLTSEGEALGLTLQDLGRQVRQGFFGEEAQRIQRGRDEVRVMVRYPRQDRRTVAALEQMRVRTPAGDEVPFSTVAAGSMGRGPTSITRVDRRRSVNVQAEVDEAITSGRAVSSAMEAEFLPQLAAQYPGLLYSFEGDEADFAESIDGLARGLAAALFVMFAMLAIPLRSYVKPAIIVSSIPFGMVGAIWGHWLLGMDVSFLSLCGMVALAGIVVNDGLVLVSFIEGFRREQGNLREAVVLAGQARFRAILLTSLTTAAGVTPLMLEKSIQAQFLIPMAVALSSGVLFATVVTLVMVPTLYLVLEDLRAVARWLLWGKRRSRVRALPKTAPSEAASGD